MWCFIWNSFTYRCPESFLCSLWHSAVLFQQVYRGLNLYLFWAQRRYGGNWLYFSVQKTVVSVQLLCSKCRQKVMKLIATIEGITSIVLDPSKNTVTVIGEADPVKIICKVRKFRKSASIMSVGPPREEKKDMVIPCTPKVCQRCDVWYVVSDDFYGYCTIM